MSWPSSLWVHNARWKTHSAMFTQSNVAHLSFTFAFIICSKITREMIHGVCKQLHLLRVFQERQMKSALYLGTALRESPDDPLESQENAGLTWRTENILPSVRVRPTLQTILESVLERKSGDPRCRPFLRPKDWFSHLWSLPLGFERMKKDNKWESRGWVVFFVLFYLEKSITSPLGAWILLLVNWGWWTKSRMQT